MCSTYLLTSDRFGCSRFLSGGTCLSALIAFGIETPKSRHEARHPVELQGEGNLSKMKSWQFFTESETQNVQITWECWKLMVSPWNKAPGAGRCTWGLYQVSIWQVVIYRTQERGTQHGAFKDLCAASSLISSQPCVHTQSPFPIWSLYKGWGMMCVRKPRRMPQGQPSSRK